MLRKIRLTLAVIIFTMTTLLFLDFTGATHCWLGWIAKMQFLPALLAVNIGVVSVLLVLTLLFGRVYCSVICPLGVFQDVVSWIAGKRKKNRFSYSPAVSWLRYGMLGIFIIAFLAGIGSLVALLDPYGAYGRIASNLFAPLYQWGNNLLAYWVERADSYVFYSVDVWIKSVATFGVALVTFVVLFLLAWRNGRTYCNTICDLFNAVKIYPQKHVRVSAKTCTCFSENTYVFFSKVRQTRFFYVHLRVIKELLRNYLWQRRQQQQSKIIQSRAGSQP